MSTQFLGIAATVYGVLVKRYGSHEAGAGIDLQRRGAARPAQPAPLT